MTSLLVDIGATSFKWTYGDNESWERARRRATPKPATPERIVEMTAQRALRRECSTISVGFPGEVRDGVVIDGANLVRSGGPSSPRDAGLDAAWRDFDLAGALREAAGIPTVVTNDAHATAYGCDVRAQRSLVVVLGTGCGVGFIEGGELVRIRDYGDDVIDNLTLDQLVGEEMRRLGHAQWLAHCNKTIAYLVSELTPDAVYVAGGNAGRLRPSDISQDVAVELVRGEPAFRGLMRLTPRAI